MKLFFSSAAAIATFMTSSFAIQVQAAPVPSAASGQTFTVCNMANTSWDAAYTLNRMSMGQDLPSMPKQSGVLIQYGTGVNDFVMVDSIKSIVPLSIVQAERGKYSACVAITQN